MAVHCTDPSVARRVRAGTFVVETHDNGGRLFRVEASKDRVVVSLAVDDVPPEYKGWTCTYHPDEIWYGIGYLGGAEDGEMYADTTRALRTFAWHENDTEKELARILDASIGNAVLLREGDRYVFLGTTLSQFYLAKGDRVTEFVNMVGNNDVTYGWFKTTRIAGFIRNCLTETGKYIDLIDLDDLDIEMLDCVEERGDTGRLKRLDGFEVLIPRLTAMGRAYPADPEGDALRKAAYEGDLPSVKRLARGFDVDVLVAAASGGHLPIVKFIVARDGADVHADDDDALRAAAIRGHLPVVKFLVAHGADVHASEDQALRYASMRGHGSVVRFLVAHGADVHASEDQALRWACREGHLAVVRFLVAHGADVHVDDDNALRVAAASGHLAVVRFLVARGATTHAAALERAVAKGHTAVANFLRSLRPSSHAAPLVARRRA